MGYTKEFSYKEHAKNNRDASAVLVKHGLTGPQMYVLRKAARPWDTSYAQNPKPHDGTVSEYGVMEKTLAALRAGGFIGQEFEHPEGKRVGMLSHADELIRAAHAIFCQDDPFREIVEGSDRLPAWSAVLVDLQVAKRTLQGRDNRVTRITLKGRQAVAEFLETLGIKEE